MGVSIPTSVACSRSTRGRIIAVRLQWRSDDDAGIMAITAVAISAPCSTERTVAASSTNCTCTELHALPMGTKPHQY